MWLKTGPLVNCGDDGNGSSASLRDGVFLDHANGCGLTRSLFYEINLVIPLVG